MFAHRAMESIILDKKTMHLKDEKMPRYAELIYNGFWFSKERIDLQKIMDQKKSSVTGKVKIKIYKGNITIQSRISSKSTYSKSKVSFEENKNFNKKNVEKFISSASRKLNG